MPVIRDPMSIAARTGTIYPKPFQDGFDRRLKRPLTDTLGLTQFGVNVTTLEPGAQSSLRHWHQVEDEFVYVLEGELTLVTDEGEQTMRAGMAAGFPAGEPNGHCLINKSASVATYLEIGTRSPHEDATYPDHDLLGVKRDGALKFTRKNGDPY